jgi:tyrocidine synthetase-3
MKNLDKKNIENILGLTPTQEGMLFHYLKDPDGAQYSEQLCLNISGKMDIRGFEKAWNIVIETNEMLRTLFRWEKLEKPAQIILKEHKCELHIYDLTDKNNSQKRAALEEIKAKDRQKTFNLGRVPFQVSLCKIAGKKYQLIISNHHILYDGWSTGIIIREFFDVYHALSSENQQAKPPVKSPFKEFIQWMHNQDKTKQKQFWTGYLADFEEPTSLPIKIKRKETKEIKDSGNYTLTLKRSIKEQLEIFIKEHRVTLAAFFYSTWGILLQRYCNTEDVIFGTTVSGRSAPIKGIQDMVGLFINTIPLRIKTDIGEKVKDSLRRVNDILPIREKYESTSLVDIKDYSQLGSSVDLFDSLIVMENYPLEQNLMQKNRQLPLVVESYTIVESTNYDLAITITVGEVIGINFIHNPLSLNEQSISRLSTHFNRVIENVLNNSMGDISEIEILSEEEKKELMYEFNDTEAAYPQDKTIHGLFAEQAERTPDHIAVVAPKSHQLYEKSGVTGEITYKELKRKSHQLAQLLKAKGITADMIVGLIAERSIELVLGIFAILKAGGAYLPIDPGYPGERVQYMLVDSQVKVLLIGPGAQINTEAKEKLIEIINISHFSSPLTSTLTCRVSPTNLAYIIYTSGSTGQPKGVMVGHSSVVNLLWALQNKYPFRQSDVYLLKTSYFFDVSVCEQFGWYFGGGRLAILEQDGEKDQKKILATIENVRVTHINFVPSMFKVFTDELNPQNIKKLSSLRYIFLAGEALLPHLINRFKRLNKIITLENIYGPTEATVYASWYSLSQWSGDDIIPIGKPLPNVQLFILDCNSGLQPVGVPGELSIAGRGMARGYLNQPELTWERFCHKNFLLKAPHKNYMQLCNHAAMQPCSHETMQLSPHHLPQYLITPFPHFPIYQTGDLARWLPDGNAEFLGRMDQQIKIRGIRIELEEIENHLLTHQQIKEVVVTTRQDNVGDKYLVAYIVPGPAELNDPDKINVLRSHLSLKLPAYMIPSNFILLEKIPLTPSGKVDRKSLTEPGITSNKAYVAPGNKTERILAGLWSKVLGIEKEKISVNDNFFELGGHSLKVARLINRIHKTFDIEIPYSKFFQLPSIRGIVSYIKEVEIRVHHPIPGGEKKEYYPLNNTQKQFYVAQQVKKGDTSYNMYETMQMQGVLSVERLESAFRQLLRRHESLRISIHLVDGEPVQKVNQDAAFNIEYYDGKTPNQQELAKISRDFVRPFDLTHAPLWRIRLVKIAPDEHLLMVDINHLIADGTSVGIFIRDFNLIYNQEPLPILNISYRDYLEWYRKLREETRKKTGTSSGSKGSEEFENESLALPTDFPRPAVPDFAGKTIKFDIGKDRVKALYGFSIKHDVTLYMVLLAVFNVLLAKLSNQETIAVGSPMSGRVHIDLDNLMGLFLNTLCLRNRPGAEKQFLTFLQEVKARTTYTFDHQEYQYNELLDRQNPGRDVGRNPLYDVMLVMQNMEMPEINIPGLAITREVGDYLTSKFDVTLYCEEKDPVVFKLEYSTALFKQETIQRLIGYFEEIISCVLENPHQKIADIEMLPSQEKQQILYDFNDTKVEYPGDRCIYQLVEAQARKTPDQIALLGVHETHEKNHNMSPDNHLSYMSYLSYRELNEKSNQLARLLRAKGIQPDTIVGIMLERSLLVVMGVLAVLKAGGAYLPLDPEYPEQRIISMLEHSRSSLILTHSSIMEEKSLPSDGLTLEVVGIEEMEELMGKPADVPEEDLEPISGPGNLIYIIFTSGSTGVPKGAGVFHRGFVNLLHWFVTEFELNPEDRNLFLTSLSFDLTQKNLYASLITGGTVCVPGVGYFDPRSLLKQTREQEVTWINCTPSMFYKMVEYDEAYHYEGLSGLRYVFLGGETIAMPFLLPWLESGTCRTEIVNTYGPTECTDICNFYRVKEPGRFMKEEVPLGMPVYNVQLYIVDRHLQLTPVGAAGELIIGGAGVGNGYINDKELTTRKFITHSFEPEQPPQLLYKTGDLAKWLPDGNMVFLGRIDHQVKVRGFRIELGEIEKRLLEHQAVKEAVITVQEEKNNEKNLCAYIILHPGSSLQNAELREYLSRELPGYMVPAYIVQLEKIPLNPNGKVDRKSLPKPDSTSKDNYAPPQNDTENQLAEIWAEVLGLDKRQVGIHDNFFLSGGHSLKATTLIGQIYKTFSVEIPITEIFNHPTIKNISRYIEQSKESLYLSIAPAEKREYYSLSSAQKRLFVIEQMNPGKVTYNIPEVLKLEGKLDRSSLAGNLKKLIARHESLRTSFQLIDGELAQKVHDDVELEIEYHQSLVGKEECSPLNCHGRGEVSSPIEIETIIREFIRPFDLSQAPLLRVGLIELPLTPAALGAHPSQQGKEHKYILMIDMHHVIADGISLNIFIEDFMALYAGQSLPGLRLQYKDYAQWQQHEKVGTQTIEQQQYWLKEFAGEIPVLEIPHDYPRPAVQQFEGSRLNFQLEKECIDSLKSVALQQGTTLYMVLLALYNILLSKLSNQEDIIIGTPVAGRKHADLEKIIGMFVNTPAMRNYPAGEKTFTEFLAEVKDKALNAFENQEYPYEDLVEQVVVNRDASRNPLFDVSFLLQNLQSSELTMSGVKLTPLKFKTTTSKFDLTLLGAEVEDSLWFWLEYSTKLFKPETIQRFANYFKNLAPGLPANIHKKLTEIEIITRQEKRRILADFNDTAADYPGEKTIHRLFQEQMKQTPDRIAVIGIPVTWKKSQDTRHSHPVRNNVSVTYAELNQRANRLAHLLQEKGAKPGTIIGIMIERSLEMMVGIMAILKAGAAYLPLDLQFPNERIKYMCKDSNTQLVVTQSDFTQQFSHINDVLPLDNIDIASSCRGAPNPGTSVPSSASAYIIYTSGTTGRPKGVLTMHYNAVRVVKNTNYIEITGDDRVLQLSNYAFDGSVFDIYGAFLNGAPLVLIPEKYVSDTARLSMRIKKEQVTLFFVTTALFNAIVDIDISCLKDIRKILFGGERVSVEHTRKALQYKGPGKILHVYGPTETTVYATSYPVDRIQPQAVTIPIGSPISNTSAYILSRYLMPVPMGVVGELYIGGEGTARGYLNNPELTFERFINYFPPITTSTHHPIYRTGDLTRWLSDGNIEFIGRVDQQVKIRGFRIELGEIEGRLLKHEAIKETVVIDRERESGDRYLCAYIVLKRDDIRTPGLKKFLLEELPPFMIPNFFVYIDEIPLNPNGKVNRKALPQPEAPGIDLDRETPRNAREEKLAQIWAHVLGLEKERIGINSNFFELGGHSLKAAVLMAKIHIVLNVKIPLVNIFQSPTIKELSQYINSKEKEKYIPIEAVEQKEYYPLSSAQNRLYLLYQAARSSTAYNMPVIMILTGKIEPGKLEETFKQLTGRHENFRTSFQQIKGEPVQRIYDEVEFEMEYKKVEIKVEEKEQRTDDRGQGTEGKSGTHQSSVIRHLSSGFIRPFDLSRAPLLRVSLETLDADKYLLMIDMHHIVSDGLSMGIMVREFMALLSGKKLSPAAIQYKDFSEWLNREKEREIIKQQETFWLNSLAGNLPVLKLPTDNTRPMYRDYEGGVVEFTLGREQTAALNQLAKEEKATLFMVLLAIYYVFLARLSGQVDIVVGTPVAGRNREELGDTMGMFVNTLALRNFPRGTRTFKEFLQELKERTLNAFANQNFPFEELVERVASHWDKTRNPLFDVMFALQNVDIPILRIPGLTLEPYPYEQHISKFDLNLVGIENNGMLTFAMEYGTAIFKQSTIQRFVDYFKDIVQVVLENRTVLLNKIEIEVFLEVSETSAAELTEVREAFEF